MKLLQAPQVLLNARKQFEVFDDFNNYVTTDLWTSDTTDDNDTAPAVGDAEYGVLTLTAGTDDNEETGIFSTREFALFQADGGFIFEARIQFTEGNTSAVNCAFGMADAPGLDDLLSDNGGGANITNSGVLIYKIDGGTVWRCNAENNGTVRDTVSVQTAGGSSYQTLTIEGRAVDATNMEIMYFVDHAPLTDSNGVKIKHLLPYASATEMNLVAYLKIGSTTTETVLVDYIYYAAVRV